MLGYELEWINLHMLCSCITAISLIILSRVATLFIHACYLLPLGCLYSSYMVLVLQLQFVCAVHNNSELGIRPIDKQIDTVISHFKFLNEFVMNLK